MQGLPFSCSPASSTGPSSKGFLRALSPPPVLGQYGREVLDQRPYRNWLPAMPRIVLELPSRNREGFLWGAAFKKEAMAQIREIESVRAAWEWAVAGGRTRAFTQPSTKPVAIPTSADRSRTANALSPSADRWLMLR